MKSGLTTSALLDVWERARIERPIQRALILLTRVYPETTLEQLQELPIGQRDSLLMKIREALFGRQLTCLAACPGCGESLEISLDITQLYSQTSDDAGKQIHTFSNNGYEVQFRLPNSVDMFVLTGLQDASQARLTLFERCVQQAIRAGTPVAAGDLPEDLVSSVASQMAQIDPQADIQVELICPNCAYQWSTAFDIVSFLWSEINSWAFRILREVHKLASAYGWREADILALSPTRRQIYLELVG